MNYIYFIRSGKHKKPIKIGYTNDIEKRLADLQVGNPRKLYVIAQIPVKSLKTVKAIEAWLHRRFRKQHIRGEWFSGRIDLEFVFTALRLAGEEKVLAFFKSTSGKEKLLHYPDERKKTRKRKGERGQ